MCERWTQTANPGLPKAACMTAQAKERQCPGLQGGRPGGGGSHTPLKMGHRMDRQRWGAGAGIRHGEEGELPAREGVAQDGSSSQGPGRLGRTVVVKKVGKADGARQQVRLWLKATIFISNLQSFRTRY